MAKKTPNYIKEACKVLGKTVKNYLKDTNANYVIVYESNGKRYPLTWEDGNPVIYGGKREAKCDMQEGDTLITEQEYLKEFCNY